MDSAHFMDGCQGRMMKGKERNNPEENSCREESELDFDTFLSFLRSRLDVISTSVYLLEVCWYEGRNDPIKYLKKINEEMESIRKFINI
jgi:hypothetical protein